MNDNGPEREQISLMLPVDILAELDRRADKRGCVVQKLIDEVCERTMARPPFAFHALLLRAQAIRDALFSDSGEEPPWPDSFDECLEVGLALSGLLKLGATDYLLEARGPEMEFLEAVCRLKGISYEEFIKEALAHHLEHSGDDDEADNDEEDGDRSDWWKQ